MSSSTPERPNVVDVRFANRRLIVERGDGSVADVPLAWFPRLRDASPKDLADWEIIGRSVGLHWEALDEDLLIEPLFHPAEASRRHDEVLIYPSDVLLDPRSVYEALKLVKASISTVASIAIEAQRNLPTQVTRNDPTLLIRHGASS